ncbi:hypothetical protein EOM57_05885, partial [Candidatus Saccharibacteria bacterium]|nr:hypothetical protein [Candidatus Saccharibacteria bacterium]
MSTEKDVRELVIITELAQLLGKAVTIYNKTTGESFGLDGQAIIDIAAQNIAKSQSIVIDSGSTTKVPVVAAVETELNNKVSLTGNETVAGTKTFKSCPVVPGPLSSLQVANKKYVDDLIAGRQAELTFGIADSNAVKINSDSVAEGDYAKFTASGLQGRSVAEVLSDIGAEAAANKNVANGYAGLDSGGKIAYAQLPDSIIRMEVDSSLGWMLGNGETTVITATVFKGWNEVTSQITSWLWTRNSGDAADDQVWNLAHTTLQNQASISFDDLGNAMQTN